MLLNEQERLEQEEEAQARLREEKRRKTEDEKRAQRLAQIGVTTPTTEADPAAVNPELVVEPATVVEAAVAAPSVTATMERKAPGKRATTVSRARPASRTRATAAPIVLTSSDTEPLAASIEARLAQPREYPGRRYRRQMFLPLS